MVDVLHLRHAFFLQYFQSTNSILSFIECFMNFAEIANANDLKDVKVRDLWL